MALSEGFGGLGLEILVATSYLTYIDTRQDKANKANLTNFYLACDNGEKPLIQKSVVPSSTIKLRKNKRKISMHIRMHMRRIYAMRITHNNMTT